MSRLAAVETATIEDGNHRSPYYTEYGTIYDIRKMFGGFCAIPGSLVCARVCMSKTTDSMRFDRADNAYMRFHENGVIFEAVGW